MRERELEEKKRKLEEDRQRKEKERERELEEKKSKLEEDKQRREEVRERELEEKKRQEKFQQEAQKTLDKLKQNDKLQKQRQTDELNKQQADADASQAAMQDELSKYKIAIKRAVEKKWAWNGTSTGLQVVYELVLSESGVVDDIRLSKSSGNPAYDESVKKAIQIASPLPLAGIKQSFFQKTFGRGVRIDFKFED